MKLLDGRSLALKVREQLAHTVAQEQIQPGLAVILVGDHPASKAYVTGKINACREAGFHSELIELPETVSQADLLAEVEKLNADRRIHGFIVQLPLPRHIDERLVIDAILPMKDADGFSPVNLGNLFLGDDTLSPATPAGIIALLEENGVECQGKHAVVVGRSNIVGKPMAHLLLKKDATVTLCHSKTADLAEHTKRADILIAASGKPKLITADHVKPGAVVIDVGMHKIEGRLCGDVAFDEVKEVASAISPVPGGVGPMTIATLLRNTLACYRLQKRVT